MCVCLCVGVGVGVGGAGDLLYPDPSRVLRCPVSSLFCWIFRKSHKQEKTT